jgi:hypothetical protein
MTIYGDAISGEMERDGWEGYSLTLFDHIVGISATKRPQQGERRSIYAT